MFSASRREFQLPCPACTGETARLFGIKNDLAVLKCASCKTLYSDAKAASDSAFNDEYSSAHEIPGFIHGRIDEILRQFTSYRRLNRLLDVGFGAGAMLDAAVRAGWDAEGVELSEAAVARASERGLKARHLSLAEARYPSGFFDVVLASELIEHIQAPADFATEVRRILRPGGLFWATTPNSKGISARALGVKWSVIHPPVHLQLFSSSGVRTLLARAGFPSARVATSGADPFEILRVLGCCVGASDDEGNFHRVESLYRLNGALSQSKSGRILKSTANAALRVTRLGDTLKIFAEAPSL